LLYFIFVAPERSFHWTLLAVAVMSVFIVTGFTAIGKVMRTDEKLLRNNSDYSMYGFCSGYPRQIMLVCFHAA